MEAFYKIILLLSIASVFCVEFISEKESPRKQPTVVIVTLIRNKAHTLPYFLSLLKDLNYPKDRISLWWQSDYNADHSVKILRKFLNVTKADYHSVYEELHDTSGRIEGEEGAAHWPPSRFKHVIALKERALEYARKMWADYIFFLDADVFLTNPDVLADLMAENVTVASPLLNSDGMYSNYWCGMTDDFYYQRTDEYKLLLSRERVGCPPVPMVHSAVLVDLRIKSSDALTFQPDKVPGYQGPLDDIIVFAMSANFSGVALHICNNVPFGYIMVPLEQGDNISHDITQLTNIKLLVLSETEPLPVHSYLSEFVSYPQKDRLGFSEIYMINLLRRPERRERMRLCFEELGMEVSTVNAVDGRLLNDSVLSDMEIRFMPDYTDPYHKRPMTLGEIGCFLSHYKIWKEASDLGHTDIMVLEDDIRFEPFFRQKVIHMMAELNQLNIDWDLIYLGRKRLQESDEPWVQGSRYLVHASYSYWTLGYLLSRRGIDKLLRARPLENMVPVDEYLPILFDQHPRSSWKGHFQERDLVALSAAPLLIYPTHYTGEVGYISDTEDSNIAAAAATIGSHDDL